MTWQTNSIQYVKRDCPFCDMEHFLEIQTVTVPVTMDGKIREYEVQQLYCDLTDKIYTPGDMLEENLKRMREATE